MVVHAGDVDPGAATWDIPEAPPSQPSQVPLDSVSRMEPFALAEDHPSNAFNEYAVPRPAPVPEEMRPVGRASERSVAPSGVAPSSVVPSGVAPSSVAPSGVAPSGVAPSSVAAMDASPTSAAAPEHRRTLGDFGGLSLPKARDASDSAALASPSSLEAHAETPQPNGRRRALVPVSVAVFLVGVVAATFLGRRTSADDAIQSGRDSMASPGPIAEPMQAAVPTAAAAHPATGDSLASAEPAAAAIPPLKAAGAAAKTNEPASAAPNSGAAATTTLVTLELKPTDAKVIYRGAAHPGPPFVFEIPKGKRIAVEVARPGFVTRKVVIDDKKPTLTVGLLRAPTPKR